MSPAPVDIALTPAVKAAQRRKGSRWIYTTMEMERRIDERLALYVAQAQSFYLATASTDGQPYVQHRGGPPGFLHVIDATTLAFVDFEGNRQFITTGNLAENAKAFIFLMDYARRQRVKIWGRARIVEGDRTLEARLMPVDYTASPEQVILFEVDAWDTNCPQHIPQLLEAGDMKRAIEARDARIAELEAEVRTLRNTE